MKELLIVGLVTSLAVGAAVYAIGGTTHRCRVCSSPMRTFEDNKLNHETIYFCDQCNVVLVVPR